MVTLSILAGSIAGRMAWAGGKSGRKASARERMFNGERIFERETMRTRGHLYTPLP